VSNALVIYGTTDGHTARIANAIGDTLRSRGLVVDVLNAKQAKWTSCIGYDAVVIAASLHARGYQEPVRAWLRRNAAGLTGRPSAFVSVCLGVLEKKASTDRELVRIAHELFTAATWRPDSWTIVAGALPWTRYGWLKKRVMRRIVAKAGGDTDTTRDFEYTDWTALRGFITTFADEHALHGIAAGALAR
jgi:menaquinone-dependent protoporphyrinogen oxidase